MTHGGATGQDASARLESEVRATLAELESTMSALSARMHHGTPGERAVARTVRAARDGWALLWEAMERHPLSGAAAFFLAGLALGVSARSRR